MGIQFTVISVHLAELNFVCDGGIKFINDGAIKFVVDGALLDFNYTFTAR